MAVDPQLLAGLGCAASIFLSAAGSALASGHSATFAIRRGDSKGFLPIVISGVLAIYGTIISALLVARMTDDMTPTEGYRYLSAGLTVGLGCLASGFGMAIFIQRLNEQFQNPTTTSTSDSGPESEPLVGRRGLFLQREVSDLHIFLSLTFLEAIGLYGLVVALFLVK